MPKQFDSPIPSSLQGTAIPPCTEVTGLPGPSSVKKYTGIWLVLLVPLLLFMTGCQIAQSAFANSASNAGSALAAASATLSYTQEGKITSAYARSSFVNYQSELSGLDQSLPSQHGAPDQHTVQQLLALYKPAIQVVNQPCLESHCDWRAQISILDQASKAFLKAGGQ